MARLQKISIGQGKKIKKGLGKSSKKKIKKTTSYKPQSEVELMGALIQNILKQAEEYLGYKTIHILLKGTRGEFTFWTPETSEVLNKINVQDKRNKEIDIKLDTHYYQNCLDKNKSFIHKNKAKEKIKKNEIEKEDLLIPLRVNNKKIGVVHFVRFFDYDRNETEAIEALDLRLAQGFIKTFSGFFQIFQETNALKKTSRKKEEAFKLPLFYSLQESILLNLKNANHLRDARRKFDTIVKVSNLIHNTNDTHELVGSILRNAQHVLKAESASLFLIDKEKNHFYLHTTSNSDQTDFLGTKVPIGQGIVSMCAKTKKPVFINNVKNNLKVFKVNISDPKKEVRNLIAAPLVINKECLGVIEVINSLHKPSFDLSDLKIFDSYTSSVAIALQKRKLLDNLENARKLLKKELNTTLTLKDVAAALIEAKNMKEYFSLVLEIVSRNLGIGRQSIFLYDPGKGGLYPEAVLGVSKNELTLPANFVEQVFHTQKSVFIQNIDERQDLIEFYNLSKSYKSKSCIILLLNEIGSEVKYGVYCLSDPKEAHFNQDDYNVLHTIAFELSRGYQKFLYEKEIISQQTLQTELHIAAKVQMDLLPNYFPEHKYFEIETGVTMAKSVGGDFYFYQSSFQDGPINLLIGDVTGKSISAAIFMAIASTMLKTILQTGEAPAKILTQANTLLSKESKRGMFVTLFLVRYEPKTKTLFYSSAGHNQMLLIKEDGTEYILSTKGRPLGVNDDPSNVYEEKSMLLDEGDTLILYTDGILDAMNKEKKEFGLERLQKVIRDNRSASTGSLVSLIFENVRKFCALDFETFYRNQEQEKSKIHTKRLENENDDIALVVCRVKKSNPKELLLHICKPAKHESIIEIINKILAILETHNLNAEIKNDIVLAIEEVLANIVTHAFENFSVQSPELEFTLNYEREKKYYFEFRDNGKQFNFEGIQAHDVPSLLHSKVVGGFGVTLIKRLMSNIDYKHLNGFNFLTFEKKITLS